MTNQRTWTIGGVTYTASLEEKARRLRNAFDPDQPRDRRGRWIETGASVSIWGGGTGTVARNLGGGRLEVHTADGRKISVHRNYLTVTAAPGGKKPSGNPADRPRPQRADKPSKGVEEFTPSGQDTRVPVSELRPGQLAYVHGWDSFGDNTSNLGRISGVSPAGPPEDADTKPGSGWAVSFVDNTNRHWTMYTTDDAMARVVPDEDFAHLVEAERENDQEQADRIAREIRDQVNAIDEAEASTQPEAAPAVEVPAVDSRVRLSNGAEGAVAKTREDGALLVRLDSSSQVNAHASDVEVIDTPTAPAESGGERPELAARQWITTPTFNDPVRVEQIQDTLNGAEVEVVTIRGDRRTLAEEELGDWQPADEPPNHRADGAPVQPTTRPQEGLFADMGTDKDGNRDLFMALDDEDDQPAPAPEPAELEDVDARLEAVDETQLAYFGRDIGADGRAAVTSVINYGGPGGDAAYRESRDSTREKLAEIPVEDQVAFDHAASRAIAGIYSSAIYPGSVWGISGVIGKSVAVQQEMRRRGYPGPSLDYVAGTRVFQQLDEQYPDASEAMDRGTFSWEVPDNLAEQLAALNDEQLRGFTDMASLATIREDLNSHAYYEALRMGLEERERRAATGQSRTPATSAEPGNIEALRALAQQEQQESTKRLVSDLASELGLTDTARELLHAELTRSPSSSKWYRRALRADGGRIPDWAENVLRVVARPSAEESPEGRAAASRVHRAVRAASRSGDKDEDARRDLMSAFEMLGEEPYQRGTESTDAPEEPEADELAPRPGVLDDSTAERITAAAAAYRQALVGDDEMAMLRAWSEFRDLVDEHGRSGGVNSPQYEEGQRLTRAGTELRDAWDKAHAEVIRENRRRVDRILKALDQAGKRADEGDLDGGLAIIDEIAAEYPDVEGWDAARAEVRDKWVDPTPLPSTDDGTPPSPEGMSDTRRAVLVAAIERMAAGYRWTGDPGRYIAEGAGKGGSPRPGEKEWVDTYIAAHPEVLTFTGKEIVRRTRQQERERVDRKKEATARSNQAKRAFDDGDFDRALELIDQAEELEPTQERWDNIRRIIREAQAEAAPAQPDPTPDRTAEPVENRTAEPGSDPGGAEEGETPSPAPAAPEAQPVGAPTLTFEQTGGGVFDVHASDQDKPIGSVRRVPDTRYNANGKGRRWMWSREGGEAATGRYMSAHGKPILSSGDYGSRKEAAEALYQVVTGKAATPPPDLTPPAGWEPRPGQAPKKGDRVRLPAFTHQGLEVSGFSQPYTVVSAEEVNEDGHQLLKVRGDNERRTKERVIFARNAEHVLFTAPESNPNRDGESELGAQQRQRREEAEERAAAREQAAQQQAEGDQAVRERAASRQQVTALAKRARGAYDAGDVEQASRLLDEAEQLAPGDPRLGMIRNTISESAQPPTADGTPPSPLTYRPNARGGVDVVRDGEVLGDVVKRGRTSWYWRVVGDENYTPVSEATRKAAAERIAFAVQTRLELAASDERRNAAREARVLEIEAEGYTGTLSSELQPGDMVRHLAGSTNLEYWAEPVLVSQVQPFGETGSVIRFVRMDGTTDITVVSGERAQVMRKERDSAQADAVWQQHLDDTDDSPAAHARRAMPDGYQPAGWSQIQPEDVVRVPRRIRGGFVLEWSSPMVVGQVEPRRGGGFSLSYETDVNGHHIRSERESVNELVAAYGVIRQEAAPPARETTRDDLVPAADAFAPDGQAAVNAAVQGMFAKLDILPLSNLYSARADLRAALDRAAADAPDTDRAAAERERLLQVADVLGRAWSRASREQIARDSIQGMTEKIEGFLADAKAAQAGGDVERALRSMDLAESWQLAFPDGQPARDWDALRAAASRGPEPDAEPSREPAPEGQAYADQVRVGDTLAEAQWRMAGPDAGLLREGQAAYANAAGPARLSEPIRDSRRVTDIQETGGRLTFTFDDGTRISRLPDTLLIRGTPADVEGGEDIPQANAQVGDRIQFGAAGPNLPAALDREALGIGRFDKVTVAGKISRRQPGLPSVVLDDIAITRADGTTVPAPSGTRFSVPRRVLRLDDSEPAPAPEQVRGASLRDGDRITGPTGDVAVERVDRLDDRLVSALVRDDDDRRERHLIAAERPVQLAPAQDSDSIDETEASGLAVGDWVVIDDRPMQVASVPEVDHGRARFDVRDQDGRLSEVELDERLLLNRVTGAPTREPEAAAAPPAEPERITAADLPDGTPTGRVRLRTDQRRRLLDLNLDATSSGASPAAAQALARLRTRRELSAEQIQALAAHVRTLARDENTPAARRRALGRTAGWIDAANARLEGFPPPPHDPGRPAPERVYARNLVMGDVIGLPSEDGTVRFGTVTATRPVKGFGLHQVHVRHEDGSVEQRVLPDGVDLWLAPDLPDDVPAPPAEFTREHVTADRIGVGDTIRWDGNDFTDPVVGHVLAVERRGGEFAETRLYEMTILDGDDDQQTITVTDRGWPSVERLERGPAASGQPYDSLMQPETAEYVGWRDLRVGDRATVSMATGTVTGVIRHPASNDVPEGITVQIMADSGEQRSVSVFDDPDAPDDYIDPSVMRLIPADDNAAARISSVRRERERISREREFTAFLANLETVRSRWAATDVAEALRELPASTEREVALAAAFEHLDRIEATRDLSAATLAFRLGARDDAQTAAMAPATSAVTRAAQARATSRIRAALEGADLLGSETWPRALSRVVAAYRDHPPAPGVLPAGVSLAKLRDRINGTPAQPAPRMPDVPQDTNLPGRLATYRAQLPDNLADLGKQPVMRTVFEPTTLEDLEAGRVPAVRQAMLWAPDIADDDGPGPEAMRQLAVIRTAGADLDVRFRQHLAGREVALSAELDAVTRERGQAWKAADDVDAEISRIRYSVGTPDGGLLWQRDDAAARWQAAAVREQELRRMLAEARREALATTLAEVRRVGGDGLAYTDRQGRLLTGQAGSNAAALRYVEEVLPSDWLQSAREAGPVEVVTGPGQHVHVRADGSTRISLPADDNTEIAPAIREGLPGRVPVPSAQPGGVAKATVAAHELGHHLEATVPGLRAAGQALLWDRTSHGDVGDRTRPEPMFGEDRGRPFEIYPGDFPDARTGRVNGDGTQEIFANVLESLAGHGDYADDDLRHWGLGVLALLATDATGPQGGSRREVAAQRGPLDGINLLALSDDQLRSLLARIDDPQAVERLRAELNRREQQRTGSDETDLAELSDAELESMLLAGWDGYGEDPAKTALQDRVIAETEAREAERRRRGDDLGDLAASDLLSMDTDDLAALYGRNLGRYGMDPALTALLDQISAELEERDRRRDTGANPHADLDLAVMSDEKLVELLGRHQPLYHSDPWSGVLVRRIFAELDDRDRQRSTEDERTPEELQVDELIAHGWDPREAYAEAYGLSEEEMDRQERNAIIDAERGAGERREQVVRRMYRKWVYEQALAAEKATNGYMLSPLGRKAGVDPARLWGGNADHAHAYASEELKRWWADQPTGRMTFNEWRAQWLGDSRDRRQAQERRQTAGNGRDFG
ncbi:hypothetical protein ACIBHY_29545 [Nonomuraea sp. NPDC050547]|uniref:hypothetical protein n=1 Tax=Nonomuraea sp. NPDC050547 TaxID=3364368 RepID=UPI0037A08B86